MSSSRLSLSFRSGGGFPRFFLLTIVFVELLCTTTAMMRVTATVTSAASPRFPFFALSRMWPGSSCLGRVGTCSSNTSTAEADVRRFMVHGLWPDYTNGSYPQFCGKFDPSCPQFDLQDLQQVCALPLVLVLVVDDNDPIDSGDDIVFRCLGVLDIGGSSTRS